MPGQHFSVKDFLLDERFLQWVKAPTPELEAYWQDFLYLHPDAKPATEEARRMVKLLDFRGQPLDASTQSAIKENIDKAISEDTLQQAFSSGTIPSPQPSKTRILYAKARTGIAATVTGLVLLAVLYFLLPSYPTGTEYTTAYGQTQKIVLPDQSVVTLNANSSLSVQESDWDKAVERRVWLKGEAFFEVQKRKTPQGTPAKFIVCTGEVQVEVLGTAFNVKARHQETAVVLSAGSVRLNLPQDATHTKKEIMMEPGDMVAVRQREVVKKAVDTTHYTGWKENKLIFEHTPVPEIIQRIEDHYGLKVSVLSDSLLEKAFTGAAPADNLQVLLDKMAVVYQLKIKRHEKEIIIEDQ